MGKFLTNGAPEMFNSRLRLAKRIKQKNLLRLITNCCIHRQLLASRAWPEKLKHSKVKLCRLLFWQEALNFKTNQTQFTRRKNASVKIRIKL